MMGMIADPRQELHDLVDRLSDDDIRRLTPIVRRVASAAPGVGSASRVLTDADIILSEPIMPDDETADEMIATIRRWRREQGHA